MTGRRAGRQISAMTKSDLIARITTSPYEQLGGAPVLRRLVDAFYDIMDSDPAAAGIRAMHGSDLTAIRGSLFDWLSGWSGGPALYNRRPDRKCIMSAHAPFPIGDAERDQWMSCMRQALTRLGLEDSVRALFEDGFSRLADALRNR